MRILLTNDDGILAPGLLALYNALAANHEVQVVAPEQEQSAVGHAITLADPIKVKKINRNGSFFGYALRGTPADCVRLGVGELMADLPDLVVSGINLGSNVGINILYSGTVSAATEAVILGLPGIAFSLGTFIDPDFSIAARFAAHLVSRLPEILPSKGVALNVNVPGLPAEAIKGVAWTKQAVRPAGEEFARRTDPRGNVYYWRGKEIPAPEIEPDSDQALLNQGYITMTPLSYQLTQETDLARLKQVKIEAKL